MSGTRPNLSINLLDPHNNPKRGTPFSPHFTDEKIQAQTGYATSLGTKLTMGEPRWSESRTRLLASDPTEGTKLSSGNLLGLCLLGSDLPARRHW